MYIEDLNNSFSEAASVQDRVAKQNVLGIPLSIELS